MIAATKEKALITIETRAMAEFEVTPEQVAARVDEFKDLHLVPGDAKSYKQVKGAYMVIVHLRNDVDKRRKELNQEAQDWIKARNSAAKQLIDPTAPLEARLKGELDKEDAREAAIAAEKIRIEKARADGIITNITALQKRGVIDPATPLSELNDLFLDTFELEITEGEYMEFTGSAQRAKEEAIAGLKSGIEKREAWERGEADRKAEAERLKKEREAQEAEAKKLAEDRRKLEEEKAKLEAERKAELDAKKREQAIKEAQEQFQAAEKARIEKEVDENKRKEAMEPDKKKIISWANGIIDHAKPEIKEKDAKSLFNDAMYGLEIWAKRLIEDAEKL